MPYQDVNGDAILELRGKTIIMTTSLFVIRYSPNALLSFSTCDVSACGLCGILNNRIFTSTNASSFLINNNNDCRSNLIIPDF